MSRLWLGGSNGVLCSEYKTFLTNDIILVGNSSSGIHEAATFKVPVVNIGTRQNNRECGKNVLHTNYSYKDIYASINKQIKKRKLNSEKIYGRGNAGVKIAKVLASCKLLVQKKISY